MKTVIYLNIGNTNTQVLSDNQVVTLKTQTVKSCALLKQTLPLINNKVSTFVVASVVPEANSALQNSFPNATFHFINWEMLSWIDFSEVDPTTIGADRLCNLAALSNLKLPAMVIDFGTAITSEVLAADFKFLGGNILPGRQLCRLALEKHTAQLPETILTVSEPPALGTTTIESIQTVDSMVIGGVQYLIGRIQKQLGSSLSVYATGGDAPYFIKHIPGLLQTPVDFTLEGLKEIQKRSDFFSGIKC
ncbi:MAG: type III pantothenate kinase [Lentisphaeria bacterium]|nr:type III pantothenate kinase [Lentisphaeria bacterium]